MGVGIPGTHMVGLPIAVALGALVGKSSYGLEVLRDTTIADLEGSVSVRAPHIMEAIGYRTLDQGNYFTF